MASIAWTDSTGSATLENAHAGTPASRFASWMPTSLPIGDKANAAADGQLYSYRLRTQHGASFELRDIPETSMALMLRLMLHLADGGTATVNTGDGAARSYTVCLAPEADPPAPQLSDETFLWYSMGFTVIAPGSADPMLCIHAV
jgi:hypothetical protein